MANLIKLCHGLDINLAGKAAAEVVPAKSSAVYGLVPDPFEGMKPKVVVKEGDVVKAGDALFVDKKHPEVKFASPVSGKVLLVERGERRKVLSVQVEADAQTVYAEFAKGIPADGKAVLKALLDSGLFGYFLQRPYAVTANPEDCPKAIFVSGFSDMPLAADFEFVVKDQLDVFQTGIDALAKMAKVYLGVKPGSVLEGVKNAEVTVFKGKCPAGNVGVQINHISPVNKGEVVWTLGAEEVLFVGRLFKEGRVDLTRTLAVAGSEVKKPHYVKAVVGAKIADIIADNVKADCKVRIIDGNPLTGMKTSTDAFLDRHTRGRRHPRTLRMDFSTSEGILSKPLILLMAHAKERRICARCPREGWPPPHDIQRRIRQGVPYGHLSRATCESNHSRRHRPHGGTRYLRSSTRGLCCGRIC